MTDGAYLQWYIDDSGTVSAPSVMHDDGAPFFYAFKVTHDGWQWDGNTELILGPRPAFFPTLDAAKSWAARTEYKWQQSPDAPEDREDAHG